MTIKNEQVEFLTINYLITEKLNLSTDRSWKDAIYVESSKL